MRVITAPESISEIMEPSVFLAGGITNCPEWQEELIELLSNDEDFVMYNPRRKNFPMDDPDAAQEQIKWEFKALEESDVFSMWFCGGTSDQPIAMYELGRHLALFTERGEEELVVIGVDPGYKRIQDVYIQTELVSPKIASLITNNLEDHAEEISVAMAGV